MGLASLPPAALTALSAVVLHATSERSGLGHLLADWGPLRVALVVGGGLVAVFLLTYAAVSFFVVPAEPDPEGDVEWSDEAR